FQGSFGCRQGFEFIGTARPDLSADSERTQSARSALRRRPYECFALDRDPNSASLNRMVPIADLWLLENAEGIVVRILWLPFQLIARTIVCAFVGQPSSPYSRVRPNWIACVSARDK